MKRYKIVSVASLLVISAVSISRAMDEGGMDAVAPAQTPPGMAPMPAGQSPTSPTGPLTWQDQPQPKGAPTDGVTTINEARGNWFFKARILKDARKLYDKIRKKVMAIAPLQDKYLAERTELDNKLNTFYQEYGFKSGEIDEHVDLIVAQLQQLETTTSPLDPQEKELLIEAKKRKEELDVLKRDVDYLQKLENAVSQALATMSAQITKANAYDEQAWDHYKKIEDILSDEAAEELLNKIQIVFDNIVAIENYLIGDFRNFFTSSSQKMLGHIEVIKQKVQALKEHGIALGKKMTELQAQENELRRQEDAQACARKLKEKEAKQRTWLSPLFDAFNWIWSGLRDFVVLLYDSTIGWFTKKPPKKEALMPAPEITPELPTEPEQPVQVPAVPVQQLPPIDMAPQPPVLPAPTGLPGASDNKQGSEIVPVTIPSMPIQPITSEDTGKETQTPTTSLPEPMPLEISQEGVSVSPIVAPKPLPEEPLVAPSLPEQTVLPSEELLGVDMSVAQLPVGPVGEVDPTQTDLI